MKGILVSLLLAIGVSLADTCPVCNFAENTTFTLEPAVVDGDGQTIKLTASVNCPNKTTHHAFIGYTIYWGDGKSDMFDYDYDAHCSGLNCKNTSSPSYINNLPSLMKSSFTASHQYSAKRAYNIRVDFTTYQYKNDGFTSGCTLSDRSYGNASKSVSVMTTPLDYCAIPEGYALFATENLTINDRASCSKKEYSSATCTVGAEKNINIGVKGSVDNAHSNETLTLRNYSKVYSETWAKTIEAQKGAEYKKKGGVTSFNYNSEISSLSFANTSDFIENGKSKTYEPGVYGDVTIRRGGTLVLNKDGVYIFRSIRFEYGSTLKLKSSKTTELYAQEFNFSGTVTGAKASNFLVGVLGSSATYVDNGFVGSVWAPRSRMVIGQFHYKIYSGSYMAKELFVPQDTKIDYVPFTKNGGCK
ncbi:hypothetical protein SAMN05720470_102151 [Fibrobacter sp. UWOV1]|nr:hypothetical protein SAMN05720470_102151 [Fibrobacter sp. UWOV1]